jgi:hypothetical protein
MIHIATPHRYARPLRKAANATAPGCALVTVVAAVALLAGCVADGRPSDQELALRGYWYHDANHQGGASGEATPQAINAATHGVWLWPPAENTRPGR